MILYIHERRGGVLRKVIDMRIEVVANKGNEVVYKKFDNEMNALIFEWELKMSGYNTKVVRN